MDVVSRIVAEAQAIPIPKKRIISFDLICTKYGGLALVVSRVLLAVSAASKVELLILGRRQRSDCEGFSSARRNILGLPGRMYSNGT